MSDQNSSGNEVEEVGVSRVSDEDFEAAKDAYERNEKTLVDLADELGISRQALSKRFKKAGAVKGSKAKEAEKEENPEGYTANRSAWIEKTRVDGYQALRQAQMLARKTIVDAAKAGRAMETIDGDLRAIQRYNKTLVDNIAMTLKVLDADDHIDENDLPGLIIEDLTEEEIFEHHKSTGALPEDATMEDLDSEEIIDESDLDIGDL